MRRSRSVVTTRRETPADSQEGRFSVWDTTYTAAPTGAGVLDGTFAPAGTVASHVETNPSTPATPAQSSSEAHKSAAGDSSAVAVSSVRAERIWAATWQCFDSVPGSSPGNPAVSRISGKPSSRRKSSSALAEVPLPSEGTPISRAQLALQVRTLATLPAHCTPVTFNKAFAGQYRCLRNILVVSVRSTMRCNIL